jgi:acetylornithine deacetylase/succinyl-diaminopimelate desuccinylase-like protein
MDLPTQDGTDSFTDDDGSVFEASIEAIGAEGITSGCSTLDPGLFCPSQHVTRAQVASFVARALDLALLTPPPRPPLIDRLAADHEHLLTFGVREAGTQGEAEALEWLAAQLEAITGHVERQSVPLAGGATSENVWSAVGSGSRTIMLGGHADSVPGSIGADDNGSGVVVLLEIARALVADPLPGATVTIIFFGAEERLAGFDPDHHHAGSRQHANELSAEGTLPDWMASIDMVGVGLDLLAVTYLSTPTAAADHLAAAAASIGVDVSVESRGDISDHEAFAALGVPAVFMWRPDNPNWHQPTDTFVDLDLLVEDVAVVRAFVDRVGG